MVPPHMQRPQSGPSRQQSPQSRSLRMTSQPSRPPVPLPPPPYGAPPYGAPQYPQQYPPQYLPQYGGPGAPPSMPPNHPTPRVPWPYRPMLTARQIMRRAVNRPAALVVMYTAIAQMLGIVGAFMFAFASAASRVGSGGLNPGTIGDETQTVTHNMGVISLASFGVAFVVLVIVDHRDILRRGFWVGDHGESGRMRVPWFFTFAVLMVTGQAAFTLLEMALTAMGAGTASPAMDAINESSVTWQMWLFVGVVGPVFEEVVFRGVVMRSLAPYGRNFAIVTSSVMFALYHGDFTQGLFAFFVGLLFGFVAMEYSIVWSIALHVTNNAILSGVLPALASAGGDVGNMAYGLTLLGVGIVGGIVVAVRHGRAIRAYAALNRSPRGTYWGWTSPWFIAFVVGEGLLVLFSIVGMFAV